MNLEVEHEAGLRYQSLVSIRLYPDLDRGFGPESEIPKDSRVVPRDSFVTPAMSVIKNSPPDSHALSESWSHEAQDGSHTSEM